MKIELTNVTLDSDEIRKAHMRALSAALRDAYRREVIRRAPHLYSAAEQIKAGLTVQSAPAQLPAPKAA